MKAQPFTSGRNPSTRSIAVMLMIMLLGALPATEAHAIQSAPLPTGTVDISVGAQSGMRVYGTGGTADFLVTVSQAGETVPYITLSVTGLPLGASASWSANPVAAAHSPGVTTTLHITTTGGQGGTPAGSDIFTMQNDVDTNSGNQTLTVDKRPLSVSANGVNKTYDGTAAARVTLSTDASAGDDVTASYTGAAFDDKHVGAGKTLTVTGISISGADAGNYALLSDSASTAADINQAPLTVTANSYGKPFGRVITFDGTEFTTTPNTLFDGDTLTKVTLFSDGAAAGAGAGGYPIIASAPLVGTGLDNYYITYVSGTLFVSGCEDGNLPVITEGATVARSMSVNGRPIPFSLTLHATDICEDTLTWSISSPASHGITTASGTGNSKVISYTPGHNYVGADHFTVQVSDGFGGTASIAVTVTVALPSFTFRSNAVSDGYMLESSENSNVGGVPNAIGPLFRLGDDASNRQYRAIVSFNTAGLPDKAVITAVTLKIKQQEQQGTNPFLTLGNIAVDIKKGAFGGAVALQALDFQALPGKDNALAFINHPVSGWYTRALVAGSFPFVNKVGNTQFRLRFNKDDNNNHVADYLKFYSGNAASAAAQPVLVIQYYLP